MQDIGTLAGDDVSAAVAINACGQVVGNSVLSAGGQLHAFIWSKVAGMVGLQPSPGFTNAGATDINNLGQVVGYCSTTGVSNRGFLWNPVGGIHSIDPLPGGINSNAVAINDLGQVVGTSDKGDVDAPHAVLWNRAGIARDLGTLAGGSWSGAAAINLRGAVVGNGNGIGFQAHAFVWTVNDGMQDLNNLIPANSGWELQSAISINVAGEIVGVGILNGRQRAFLLTPQSIM